MTIFWSLVVPTACTGNVRLTGANDTAFTPVPETSYSNGLIAALFAIEILPSVRPVMDGVNVAWKVHFALAARVPLQGFVPLGVAVKPGDGENPEMATARRSFVG